MVSTASTSFCIFLALCCTVVPHVANANAFLKATHKSEDDRLSADAIETSLLEEVENVIGVGSASNRLDGLQAMLKNMFAALPKNEHGNLGHSTVRYALHRLFIQRHGWSIKGLDRAGGSWNASSTAGVLKDQVPTYVQDLFEARLGGRGMGLQELVIMAATIEHIIHNEAVGRLGEAYKVHQLLPSSLLDLPEARGVLDTYMMTFILGENLTTLTLEDVRKIEEEIHTLYMQWNETQEMVHGELDKVWSSQRRPGAEKMDFSILAKTAEKVGEDFGSFQDGECKQLKSTLLKMGDYRTGRVRLSDFYKPVLQGQWQFQESPSYLRQLGALDEANPEDPMVVVTNYLYSQSNCIAASSYYAVCCMDECEGLLSSLEKSVGAPQAEPEHLVALVSELPSSTVTTPRTLSPTLRNRLNDIASGHWGTVPLHGRLFAQWMHLAFPRECAFPHVSNTTGQQLPEEWQRVTGTDPTASDEEMQRYIAATTTSQPTSEPLSEEEAINDWHETAPWSPEEELLVVRTAPATRKGPFPACFRSLALIAASVSLAVAVIRTLLTPAGDTTLQKIMV